MFANRMQAGTELADKVFELLNQEHDFNRKDALIVALPRGGVPIAKEIALKLGRPMDVLVSKKIGAPGQPELAMGAVSSDGVVVLEESLIHRLQVPFRYIEEEKERLKIETQAAEQRWLASAGIAGRAQIHGKWVVAVDDGIATGMTALAAVKTLKLRGAQVVILASPVTSIEAHRLLADECDYLVTLKISHDFTSVGQFYVNFSQVDDRDVVDDLIQASRNASAHIQ